MGKIYRIAPAGWCFYLVLLILLISPRLHAWDRNVELFIRPTTKRLLLGGQALQPVWQDNDSLAYIDMRGTLDPDETEEVNLGLGFRRILPDRNWYLGGFGAFDTRKSSSGRRFNQVTLGLEAISVNWDVRTNGYLPVTDKKLVGSTAAAPVGSAYFSGFDLIQPYAQGTQTYEEALTGVDVEAGRLLSSIPFGETRLFFGSYYFTGDTVRSTGAGLRARLEFRPWKNIIIDVSTKHDRLFGTETGVTLKYSLGYKHERGTRTLSERMIQLAERDIDVAETSGLPAAKRTLTVATDPTEVVTSSDVVHIDNTAPPGGDGSYSHPFDGIASCKAAYDGTHCGGDAEDSVIYVHAGDGTSTGLDETINMRDNQKLIGQGYDFMGIGGDEYPVINTSLVPCHEFSCAQQTAVTLANNNEVAGLHITGPDERRVLIGTDMYGNQFGTVLSTTGITGQDITSFNIHDNLIDKNNHGIIIYDADSRENAEIFTSGIIANNRIVGLNPPAGPPSGILQSFSGIQIDNNSTAEGGHVVQNVVISGNTVTNTDVGLAVINLVDSGGSAEQTIDLSAGGNRFEQNSNGASFNNNAFSTATGTQTINLTGAGNQFNDNRLSGVSFRNDGAAYPAGPVAAPDLSGVVLNQTAILSYGKNQFNHNGLTGLSFINNSNLGAKAVQTVVAVSSHNQFNDNSVSGLLLDNETGSQGNSVQSADFSVSQNTFNNNQGVGIQIINRYFPLSSLINGPFASQEQAPTSAGIAHQSADFSGNNVADGNSTYGVYIENSSFVSYIDPGNVIPVGSVGGLPYVLPGYVPGTDAGFIVGTDPVGGIYTVPPAGGGYFSGGLEGSNGINLPGIPSVQVPGGSPDLTQEIDLAGMKLLGNGLGDVFTSDQTDGGQVITSP